jgi:hypothetical protein
VQSSTIRHLLVGFLAAWYPVADLVHWEGELKTLDTHTAGATLFDVARYANLARRHKRLNTAVPIRLMF